MDTVDSVDEHLTGSGTPIPTSGRSRFTEAELAFLRQPRGLARVATVAADGMPHVVPTGWSFTEQPGEPGELLLTGRDVARTQRVRNLAANPRAAIVIDGVDQTHGWQPWALIVRGTATFDPDRDGIVLTPSSITSWGL